jgi:hypothetical protein
MSAAVVAWDDELTFLLLLSHEFSTTLRDSCQPHHFQMASSISCPLQDARSYGRNRHKISRQFSKTATRDTKARPEILKRFRFKKGNVKGEKMLLQRTEEKLSRSKGSEGQELV